MSFDEELVRVSSHMVLEADQYAAVKRVYDKLVDCLLDSVMDEEYGMFDVSTNDLSYFCFVSLGLLTKCLQHETKEFE